MIDLFKLLSFSKKVPIIIIPLQNIHIKNFTRMLKYGKNLKKLIFI